MATASRAPTSYVSCGIQAACILRIRRKEDSLYSPVFPRYNTTMIWKPWTLFTVAVAGWMSRQQQEVIAYLREENKILREKLGQKRILLSIEQKQYFLALTRYRRCSLCLQE